MNNPGKEIQGGWFSSPEHKFQWEKHFIPHPSNFQPEPGEVTSDFNEDVVLDFN